MAAKGLERNSCGTHRRDTPTRYTASRSRRGAGSNKPGSSTAAMASSSTLDLAMGPGVLVPRSAVPYASFARGRGRSASGRRSRNLVLSASFSNGAAVPSLTTDSEKKGPVIMEIPLDQIRRPLMRTRANDPVKVQELMDSIRVIGLQVPIDVLEVDGVYYGFSGCHRYEAHQRLGLPTIRCKVRRGTKETLRHHMR